MSIFDVDNYATAEYFPLINGDCMFVSAMKDIICKNGKYLKE